MRILNNETWDLVAHIEEYLGYVIESSLHVEQALRDYLLGRNEYFQYRLEEVSTIEQKADEILKKIKYELHIYVKMPDVYSDLFMLVDDIDDVIDIAKDLLLELSIEQPIFPGFIREDVIMLTESSTKGAGAMVSAVRGFLNEAEALEQLLDQVVFYEEDADTLEESIKRKVFSSGEMKRLSWKIQMKYFCERIALISDKAEDIAKNVLIYSVKWKA